VSTSVHRKAILYHFRDAQICHHSHNSQVYNVNKTINTALVFCETKLLPVICAFISANAVLLNAKGFIKLMRRCIYENKEIVSSEKHTRNILVYLPYFSLFVSQITWRTNIEYLLYKHTFTELEKFERNERSKKKITSIVY